MSEYKTIFSGRLEFGSERSFQQVLKQFQHRTENYYRNDVLLKEEEVFDADTFALDIPRLITLSSEKSWKNTVNLLRYVNEFAIAGNLHVWVILEGKLIHHETIEPDSDKAAVQAYLKGRELIKSEGMEDEAKKALDRAIQKFERHALAYERRGYVNFKLRNYKDALYDFTKSIDINPNNPEPYWGRARVKMLNKDLKGALADLEMAIKRSIPHQSIHWSARRMKGQLHLELGEFQKAIFELKLLTKRSFSKDDPNYALRPEAFTLYGKALMEVGEHAAAIEALDQAVKLGKELNCDNAEALYLRGLARKKAGESGFINDLKEAANLGSPKALELLDTLA